MSVPEYGRTRVPIRDAEVSQAISNNVIVFLRWTGFDTGVGIVYSIDGNTPSESSALPFLTEIKPLSVEGWYYYRECFNEWRRRNR